MWSQWCKIQREKDVKQQYQRLTQSVIYGGMFLGSEHTDLFDLTGVSQLSSIIV